MNRIDQQFAACRAAGRPALVMYLTAGDPDLQTSARILAAVAGAGADVIEIGVPFSDPMADGPVIQAAAQRALAAGANLKAVLAMARQARADGVQTPFVLFSYYNVVLQYGPARLAADAAAAGIDGVLLVDVPAEEAGEILPDLVRHGLHWIPLLAPTTPPARARQILATAGGGFVYYITVTGVTGARSELPADLAKQLAAVKALTSLPVAAGFGVSSPEMAAAVGRCADGVVVGSALVKRIAAAADPAAAVAAAKQFTAALAAGLRNRKP